MLTKFDILPQTKKSMKLHGIWLTNVDSKVLHSRDNIAEAMDFFAETGFNVVFPIVWNKVFTLYPSQLMQATFGREIETISTETVIHSQK